MNDEQVKVMRNAIAMILAGLADGYGRDSWEEFGQTYWRMLDEAKSRDEAKRPENETGGQP